jgi:hypothetical protein
MVIKSNRYNLNDFPLRSKVAIIVTSWDGHRMFLKSTLENYMQTGAYVICSYDANPNHPKQYMMGIPHSWVFKHRTFGADKRNGWLWDVLYAGTILKSFNNIETVFTVNSDCVWEKPQNINELIKFLGDDCDMMPVTSNGTIHTCAVMYKAHIFQKFVDWVSLCLKNNLPESYSPEGVIQDFVSKNNIKNMSAPLQPRHPKKHRYSGQVDHYSSSNQNSTWKNILGYRNLGAELRQCSLEHLESPPKKYFDISKVEYYTKHEHVLLKYFETDDRRWLYKYWAEGEDSYWNRRYYPIEYYGDKPLHDDFKREKLGPPSERLGHFDRVNYGSFILKDDLYYSKWKKIIRE